MALFGAITSAVSALNVAAGAVAASADNVANVRTDGYKASEVRPVSVVTKQATTAYAAGGVRGVTRSDVDVQGLLKATESSTDLAISGRGFFPVRSAAGVDRYTRNGGFSIDENGVLTNSAGAQLLAYPTDTSGAVTGGLEPVTLSGIGGTADATTRLAIGANLPAGAAVGERFTANARIIDSLGTALQVPVTFEKTATDRYTITVGDPTAPDGTTAGTAQEGGGGAYAIDAVFDGDGALAGFDVNQDGTVDASTAPNLTVAAPTTGASDLDVALDFGTVGGLDGLTRFAGPFLVSYTEANGAAYGSVSGVNVGNDGVITVQFANGERRPIYRVPVAVFTNPDGLEAETGNLYGATERSGPARLEDAGTGGAGTVEGGALEQSNVDLGTEFVRQILARTAYEASLSTIRTAEELSDELVNIRT